MPPEMPYNRGSLILSLTLPLLLTAALIGWRNSQVQPICPLLNPQPQKKKKAQTPKPVSPSPCSAEMAAKAIALKEEGNSQFQQGNYTVAETLYTHALQKDPSNPKLHTNRAMARLKLARHDACIDDCLASLALAPKENLKAHYLLASAQLALRHPNEALASALTAYDECLRVASPSTSAVSTLVLQAKKERWEQRERERVRRRSDLLAELEDGLRTVATYDLSLLSARVASGALSEADSWDERAAVETSTAAKIEELRSVFAAADPTNLRRREVPDYLIDSISFSVMHDPVVTKTGQSYDRVTIFEHLKRSGTDPLTREPLGIEDVRPNLGLKQACEEFLRENGWAVDW